MMRTLKLLFAVFVVLAVFFVRKGLETDPAPELAEVEVDVKKAPVNQVAAESRETRLPKAPVIRSAATSKKSPNEVVRLFRAILPVSENLDVETAADPHATPSSLKSFARDLEGLVAAGLRDPVLAESLFRELSGCARGEGEAAATTLSLRVHCFRQARRLSGSHPKLLSLALAGLEKRLDDRTRLILKAMSL